MWYKGFLLQMLQNPIHLPDGHSITDGMLYHRMLPNSIDEIDGLSMFKT